MTEADPQLVPETTWPVLEACLLAGLADEPERLAHAIERVEDLLPADSERLLPRVNSWLSRFRYEFTVERAPDGRLHPTGSDTPGRQARWPIVAEVVDSTAMSSGRVRVRLCEPDGTELVVETCADDALTPGAWVGVTGTLVRRIVEGGVLMGAPAPESGRFRVFSHPASAFAEGYLAADPPGIHRLVAWVERTVARVEAGRLAGLLVLGLRQAFPARDHADLMLSNLNQVLLSAGFFLQRDADQLALVEDRGETSVFHTIRRK